MTTRHEAIADILMGAAHADQHLDGRELEKVRQLLMEATGNKQLSMELEARLETFEAKGFDLAATVKSLGLSNEGDMRHLLELVTAVHDSDEIWDLDEDAYLRDVATAMGLDTDAFSDLTVEELELEDIGAALMPPPLPKQS